MEFANFSNIVDFYSCFSLKQEHICNIKYVTDSDDNSALYKLITGDTFSLFDSECLIACDLILEERSLLDNKDYVPYLFLTSTRSSKLLPKICILIQNKIKNKDDNIARLFGFENFNDLKNAIQMAGRSNFKLLGSCVDSIKI